MNNVTYTDAFTVYLDENYKGQWNYHSSTFATIEWKEGVTPPDEAVFNSGVDAKLASLTFKEARAVAYPSIQEQLDMQYWDSINGTTTWADAIQAVKDAYPKP